jgi:hypothetical protein
VPLPILLLLLLRIKASGALPCDNIINNNAPDPAIPVAYITATPPSCHGAWCSVSGPSGVKFVYDDWEHGPNKAPFAIDLNGQEGAGAVQQLVVTVPGEEYQLCFQVMSNPKLKTDKIRDDYGDITYIMTAIIRDDYGYPWYNAVRGTSSRECRPSRADYGELVLVGRRASQHGRSIRRPGREQLHGGATARLLPMGHEVHQALRAGDGHAHSHGSPIREPLTGDSQRGAVSARNTWRNFRLVSVGGGNLFIGEI